MFDAQEVGRRIRNRREELNLSLGEFAALLGLSKGFVRLVELGKRFVIADKLINISNLLNVSTDYILKGTEDRTTVDLPKEKLRYLIEKMESEEEVDFHIKLAFILKRNNCGPEDFENIYKTISAFTSFASSRKQIY